MNDQPFNLLTDPAYASVPGNLYHFEYNGRPEPEGVQVTITLAVIYLIGHLGIGQIFAVRVYHELVKRGREPSGLFIVCGSVFLLVLWPLLLILNYRSKV